MSHLIVYIENEKMDQIQLLPDQEMNIGRHLDSDYILQEHPGISRHHFKLLLKGNILIVTETANTNNLIFKGIDATTFEMNHDDFFHLPPYRFVFSSNPNLGAQENSIHVESEQEISTVDEESIDNSDELNNDDAFFNNEEIPSPENELENQFSSHTENSTLNGNSIEGLGTQTQIDSSTSLPYIRVSGMGGKKPEYFRLEGLLWVAGSSPKAAIPLMDLNADPSQFEISKTNKGFFITDLESTSGTSLNGQKLSPMQKSVLVSGDIIQVGQLNLRFELRDKMFSEQVNQIPIHMYQNPLVYFGKDAGVLNTTPEEFEKPGKVESIRLGAKKQFQKPKNNRLLIYGVLGLLLVLGLSLLDSDTQQNPNPPTNELDPFQKLSKNKQKIVVETYRLAKDAYLNGKYDLALQQLNKLHLVFNDGYKDSFSLLEQCENHKDLMAQREAIEREKLEAAELEQQVAEALKICSDQYKNSTDLKGARSCLARVISMDPSNPEIEDLFAKIKARKEQQKINEKKSAEIAEKVRRGKNLFLRAKAFEKQNDLAKAIEAYEDHIHSGLPDPQALISKSKRSLASIETIMKAQKKKYISSAEIQLKKALLKQALLIAKAAQKIDPHDYEISKFVFKIEQELNSKMKNLYADSVIDERFGNLPSSRAKWEEIIQSDVKTGEYFQKASRKMQQYGFEIKN